MFFSVFVKGFSVFDLCYFLLFTSFSLFSSFRGAEIKVVWNHGIGLRGSDIRLPICKIACDDVEAIWQYTACEITLLMSCV